MSGGCNDVAQHQNVELVYAVPKDAATKPDITLIGGA